MNRTMRTASDNHTLTITANESAQTGVRSANDRRRRPRLAGRATGWVFLGDDDHAPAREIAVIDVSRLGVGFISETRLDEGFVCRVRIGFGPKRLARRLKIVNCRRNSDGTFTLGGEFA
jgi:hypothetical protein